MYEISKEFEFDFGHRVWSQNLDSSLSNTSKNKCRYLHGHRGKIILYLSSNKIENGMVLDFNNLNWFKKWVDTYIDHKFFIDINDPLLPRLLNIEIAGTKSPLEFRENFMFKTINLEGKVCSDDILVEFYESLVIVSFVPTAENICKWIYELIKEKLKEKELNDIILSKVEFFETPKSSARYFI